jgi:hypothetical protein
LNQHKIEHEAVLKNQQNSYEEKLKEIMEKEVKKLEKQNVLENYLINF